MEIVVRVRDDDQSEIAALDLAEFILDLRAAYVAGRMYVGEDPSLSTEDVDQYVREHLERFKSYSADLHTRPFGRPLRLKRLPADIDLRFQSISRNSPMEFVVVAVGLSVVALALAVCASGGQVDLKNLKFEVNPPKETIKALHDLFRKRGGQRGG